MSLLNGNKHKALQYFGLTQSNVYFITSSWCIALHLYDIISSFYQIKKHSNPSFVALFASDVVNRSNSAHTCLFEPGLGGYVISLPSVSCFQCTIDVLFTALNGIYSHI